MIETVTYGKFSQNNFMNFWYDAILITAARFTASKSEDF